MPDTAVIRNAAWLIAWDATAGRQVYRRGAGLAFAGVGTVRVEPGYGGPGAGLVGSAKGSPRTDGMARGENCNPLAPSLDFRRRPIGIGGKAVWAKRSGNMAPEVLIELQLHWLSRPDGRESRDR